MNGSDLRSLLEALGLRKPRPRRYCPDEARLPRIHYAEEAVAAYAAGLRSRTRLWFPAVAVLVVLRARNQKHQQRGGEER